MTAAEYARWCGPAAIASALGADRVAAAAAIIAVGRGTKKRGSCTIHALGRVLRRPVVEIQPGDAAIACPTLARWLRENPDREAVLRASQHFVHVKEGRVVEANGWEPRRGRVTHAIYLDTPKGA